MPHPRLAAVKASFETHSFFFVVVNGVPKRQQPKNPYTDELEGETIFPTPNPYTDELEGETIF
jgi:hypothetical protein